MIYVPLLVVLVNSFNTSRTFAWPPTGFTLEWWGRPAVSEGVLSALWTSIKAGLGATAIALVLGTMAAFAVQRYRFFGRDTVSFLVILPIALPGIITGIALANTFRAVLGPTGITLGLATVIIGHATFCIVVVYNNVLARLRRTRHLAGGGLGRPRRRHVPDVPHGDPADGPLGAVRRRSARLRPVLRRDHRDDVHRGPGVQTLPIWIFGNLFRPNQAPVVNVVAAALIVLSFVPVWLAARLGVGESAGGRL